MLHAFWFFQYLGVNYTVLGLTSQDYLIRSADGLLLPLAMTTAVCLIVLWVYRIARAQLPPAYWHRITKILTPLAVVIGLALLAVPP
jgi:hypothetical protein